MSCAEGLFVNPVTYGRTPWIEAWRIALCPACSGPAVSAIDRPPSAAQRMVEYRCAAGHTWRTSWFGQSRMIHREPAPGARTDHA